MPQQTTLRNDRGMWRCGDLTPFVPVSCTSCFGHPLHISAGLIADALYSSHHQRSGSATRWNCSYSSQFLTSLFSNPLQGRDAESGGFEPPSALAEAAFEAAAIVHSANSPGKNSCQCSVISSFANKVSVVTLKMFCNDFTFCFQDKINVFPLFPFHTFIISLTFTNN